MRYQVLTDQKVRERDTCRQISNSKKMKYELIVQKKLHFPREQSSSVCLSYQGKTFNYQPAEAASESSSRENNGAPDNASAKRRNFCKLNQGSDYQGLILCTPC